MAQRKTEAWLTNAVDDSSAMAALVLAETLRRARTTRSMGVVVSGNVSEDKGNELRAAFDFFLMLGENQLPPTASAMDDNTKARLLAFSLTNLNKCVFLSPYHLVLENADELFENTAAFRMARTKYGDGANLSLFSLRPDFGNWKALWAFVESENKECTWSNSSLINWVKNQVGSQGLEIIGEEIVAEFSLEKGLLLSDRMYAPIIHFTDLDAHVCLETALRCLAPFNMCTREKHIVNQWMSVYRELVSGKIQNPFPVPSAFGSDTECLPYINEPIAIIGMSCRYPGASSVEEFWNLLYRGDEGICEPPAFRWTKEHAVRTTSGERAAQAGFLPTRVDEFDAKFFGLSPKEATFVDPQIRILHEVMWESLENSGISPLHLRGTHTGIFTGSWMSDYRDITLASGDLNFFRSYMGNSIGAAAARMSFHLGLTGPSIGTESGCSSAMVALDLAVKSLRSHETNLALTGGVNLILIPFHHDMIDSVVAPDGRCKTFDSSANGFGRSEGCGVLVLKRLSDALRDRDNVWAVIRGSAISQEGLSRSMGTPTVHCEALAMTLALKDANVTPDQVSFVETHGTGTAVGDPMEVAAVAKAYYSPGGRRQPLILGSVKTNVAHTESCSGITGIMKTVLALQHELIPKHLNLKTLNPDINLEAVPAVIPLDPIPWPKVTGQRRIAGVSSFGITGTDGHVILEEAPEYQLPKFTLSLERPLHLLKMSAKSEAALDEMIEAYKSDIFKKAEKEAISGEKDGFGDTAYTSNVGRATFSHRAYVVARNHRDAVEAVDEGQLIRGEVKETEERSLCFLFTGQGSQYPGMASLLYETSPVFRTHFDICDHLLQSEYNLSIREALWGSESGELCRSMYSQTSIFCVEYCLLKLWLSWGVKPTHVLGHSLGEFTAAVAAGILDLPTALKLVVARSRLIDNLPRGSMLVLRASQQEVLALLQSAQLALDIAAVNTPEQTVVAGDTQTIIQFSEIAKARGIKTILLETTHAFHSRHMDPILEEYKVVVDDIVPMKGCVDIQYVSGVTGGFIADGAQMDTCYWLRHTREKVSFIEACESMKQIGCQGFLEIGPQPVLCSFIRTNVEGVPLHCFPSLRRGGDDWEVMLTSLAKLNALGHPVNWEGFDAPYLRKKVSLPFHPFHRKSYWLDTIRSDVVKIHPLVGHPVKNASIQHIFQNDLRLDHLPYLRGHSIGTRVILPGAAFAEMCLSAGHYVASGLTNEMEAPQLAVKLENLKIASPLELTNKPCRVQVLVDLPEASGTPSETPPCRSPAGMPGFRARVFQQNMQQEEENGKWVLHATSTFHPVTATRDALKWWDPARTAQIMENGTENPPHNFYSDVGDVGLNLRDSFKTIQKFWTMPPQDGTPHCDDVVAEIAIPPGAGDYLLHPVIMDAMFQVGTLTQFRFEDCRLKVPVSIGGITLFQPLFKSDEILKASILYLHAWVQGGKHHAYLCTANLTPVCLMEDVELLDTNVKAIESVLEQQSSSVADALQLFWKTLPTPKNSVVEHLDVDHLFTQTPLLQEMTDLGTATPVQREEYRRSCRLVYLYILHALQELGWEPTPGERWCPQSLSDYLGIMDDYRQLVRFYLTVLSEEDFLLEKMAEEECWRVVKVPPGQDQVKQEMERLSADLKGGESRSKIEVMENIAHHLGKILSGEESALVHLFPTEEEKKPFSAETFYFKYTGLEITMASMKLACGRLLREAQQLEVGGSSKVLRVLEVGAGTGRLTREMLQMFKDHWGRDFEYYFTDISPAFLVKAEDRLSDFREHVRYAVFNVEKSPLSQGVPLNYFDVVLSMDVFHATRDLQECLTHVRQTMKPWGILLFSESKATDVTFVFGLLEGYWRFQDFQWRSHHPCVEVDTWRQLVHNSGFSSFYPTQVYNDTLIECFTTASPTISLDQLEVTSKYPEARKEWLLFSDASKVEFTATLANILEVSGYRVTVIHPRGNTEKNGREAGLLRCSISRQTVAVDTEADVTMTSFLESVCLDGSNIEGIVYAWGLDHAPDQNQVARPFLGVVKYLVGMDKPPQLMVVSQGLHLLSDDEPSCNPSTSTIFAMAKCLKVENFGVTFKMVDLESDTGGPEMANQVLYEMALMKNSREPYSAEIVYRDGVRHEPRLRAAALSKPEDSLKLPSGTDRYQLIIAKTRTIQDLEFTAMAVADVHENQIEIRVKAYALNFRDIFSILKPLPQFEHVDLLGSDFAGVVTRVGNGVTKFTVGDRVLGFHCTPDAPLPSHLILTDAGALTKVPEGMTFEEASTFPVCIGTVYLSLMELGEMTAEDTVLIHTASGGVGLFAIAMAKHVGATIIATAGSARKRAYLRSLGIEHVFHSRDTSFQEGIRKVTKGRGVNLVLNSITGPGIKEATLASCAKNARFIEMSKLSVWTAEEVHDLRPDVRYSVIDLFGMTEESRVELVQNGGIYIHQGIVKPVPYVRFDAVNVRQAFQYFQKARHIGKVVCVMPDVTTKDGQLQVSMPLFNQESTYLITGGLGGIGFEVCKWMVGLGAVNIVLMGRSAPKGGVVTQIEEMNSRGCNLMVRLGDVGNFAECKAIIKEIRAGGRPLRGVMHCAGVLRNNMYPNQTWDSFQATFTPKVNGTWNLHNLTKDESPQLEHFVMFSSMAALLGLPGQANHTTANAFEDAFIHYRHSLGLPGTSINWGQWAQVGCAKEAFVSGVLPVSNERMLNGLELSLRAGIRQVCFSDFESFQKLSTVHPFVKFVFEDRLLNAHEVALENMVFNKDSLWSEMDGEQTREGKETVLATYLKAITGQLLRLSAEDALSEDASLPDLGVDSLMMIELNNAIQSLMEARVVINASLFKNVSTIRQMARVLVAKMEDNERDDDGKDLEPLDRDELIQLLHTDCRLDISIQASAPAPPTSNIKCIFVTGVTGQLAPYLVSSLCAKYKFVGKIICMVRPGATGAKSATEVVKRSLERGDSFPEVDLRKIAGVYGDVAQDNFGLSPDKYSELCSQVDAVIHCAAKKDISAPYKICKGDKCKDIRSVNVGGTLNILKFAATTKTKQIYYASSMMCGVLTSTTEDTMSDDWPDTGSFPSLVDVKTPGEYLSRIVSEILLKEACHRGIPCKVFRFPWISGESGTGRVHIESNQFLHRYLSFLQIGAMPSVPLPLNAVPVDICAGLSLQLFLKEDTPCQIYNVGHPQPPVEQEFVQLAQEQFGRTVDILEWQDFNQRLQEQYDMKKDPGGQTLYLINSFLVDASPLLRGYLHSPTTFFSNAKLCQFIPDYGKEIPSSREILKSNLAFAKAMGSLTFL